MIHLFNWYHLIDKYKQIFEYRNRKSQNYYYYLKNKELLFDEQTDESIFTSFENKVKMKIKRKLFLYNHS